MPGEERDCVGNAVRLFGDTLHMRSAWVVIVSPEDHVEAVQHLKRLRSGCCARPGHGAQRVETRFEQGLGRLLSFDHDNRLIGIPVMHPLRAVERKVGKRSAVQALRAVWHLPPHILCAIRVVYALVIRLEATFTIPYLISPSHGYADHRPCAFATSSSPASRTRSVTLPPRRQA